jgi:redox-sensitive bicupin YhaK (pirin superfamily)
MYVSRLEAGQSVGHPFAPDFGGYLLVLDGAVTINGEALANGDAAMTWNEDRITIEGAETSELLMMEMQVKVRTD